MENKEDKKPGRGRPAKEAVKLTRSINLKLTEADFEALRQKAASLGMTTTQYTRQMALTGKIVDRYTKEQLELRRKLAGMANNLNQIAKQANKSGFLEASLDIVIMVEQLKKLFHDR